MSGRRAARRRAAWMGLGGLAVLLAGRWLGRVMDAPSLQLRLPDASLAELASWWLLATQNTLALVLGASLGAALLGGALGASSAYADSAAGGLWLRLLEFLGSVPAVILAGVLRLADPSGGVFGLLATLTLLRGLEVAQLVRAEVVQTLPADFVEASRALGASRRWQLRVHVLPRLLGPLGTNLLLGAATLVGLEAALGFVGLGLPARVPSWGGGLGTLAHAGGSAAAFGLVFVSIGASGAALHWLAARNERRRAAERPGAPPPHGLAALGAAGQGS